MSLKRVGSASYGLDGGSPRSEEDAALLLTVDAFVKQPLSFYKFPVMSNGTSFVVGKGPVRRAVG